MDKKSKIEIAITSILILFFVLALSRSVIFVKRRFAPDRAKIDSMVSSLKSDIKSSRVSRGTSVLNVSTKNTSASLTWGRCPFSGKAFSGQGKAVDLKITGILWDPKKPQAIIGDEIVKPGDIIGQYIVAKINKNSVVVNDGNKDIEIKLE